MLEWNFSPNIKKTFIDYHMSSLNEPEFSFSQIYKYQKNRFLENSNHNYPSIKLDYSLNLNDSFEKMLYERKTCISYFKNLQLIDKEIVAKFCNLAFIGGKEKRRRRTYPSGGSEYNIKIYILFNEKNVDLELIEYGNIGEINFETNTLMIKKSEPWEKIKACFIQKYLSETAQLSIVLSVDMSKISRKYHDISYKLVQQEAGHIGQNIQLVSQYLGIQSVPLGSFYDTMLSSFLGDKQTILYSFLLG